MEFEQIIDETATIQGADIETVYDDCLAWLKKNRADITLMEKPTLIQANHRRGLYLEMTTPEDWHKEISIKLEQLDSDVNIHLLMGFPQKGSRTNLKKITSFWPLMVENIWDYIGVEISKELLINLYPVSVLEFILDHVKNNVIMSFIALVSPIILGIFGNILTSTNLDMMSIVGYCVMVALLLIWIGGRKYLHVRHLLFDLYPDR